MYPTPLFLTKEVASAPWNPFSQQPASVFPIASSPWFHRSFLPWQPHFGKGFATKGRFSKHRLPHKTLPPQNKQKASWEYTFPRSTAHILHSSRAGKATGYSPCLTWPKAIRALHELAVLSMLYTDFYLSTDLHNASIVRIKTTHRHVCCRDQLIFNINAPS